MSHEPTGVIEGLPENARRPLEPGETYVPIVPDETGVYEVTARAVTLGLMFCAVFSMAAAYLALKVGQGIEAAIPIAILAIGISSLLSRKSTILENVIIQSIGSASGVIVAGAIFTIPAFVLAGVWDQIHLLETTREILEGTLHTGTGAVVQFIGEKI